jgi:hypothetical protein
MIANRGFYQTFQNGPVDGNRNQYIQRVSERLMENTCPIILRRFVEAQYAYESKRLNQPDGQNIRIKILVATTVGALFCLASRIVRTAVRTLALPLSIPYSFGKQQYYGIQGEVSEEFKRTMHEWVDLGVSLVLPFVGVVKFFKPDVANSFCRDLLDYYIRRIDEREARDNQVIAAIERYRRNRRGILDAWNRGAPSPAQA